MRDNVWDDIKRGVVSYDGKPKTLPEAGQEPTEGDELTLEAMNGRYSRLSPANKEIPRLHVIDQQGNVQTFQYMYLDARSTFTGGKFMLLFAGAKHWQLEVEGHGKLFWRVYDYCTLRRWPYIRETTRDFGNEEETVITRVKVTDVTPKRE